MLGLKTASVSKLSQGAINLVIHTLLFYQIEPLKNGASLILPSSIAFIGTQCKKIFFKSCEGFLRAALTVHGHPSPVWKIAKMALFDPCMEFENFWGQMTSFEVLLKCHSLTLSKKCLRLQPALSKCLSERINWIFSTIPHRISKILFVHGSYEFLAMVEGKIRDAPFF